MSLWLTPKKRDNYFIDEDDEESHQVLSKIREGTTSVTYKVMDTKKQRIMRKKILKCDLKEPFSHQNLQNKMKEFQELGICGDFGVNTVEKVKDANIDIIDKQDLAAVAILFELLRFNLKDMLKSGIWNCACIHRDLNVENIMFNSVYEAKLVDFGLVRIQECFSNEYSFVGYSITIRGKTLSYMSYEMVNEEDYKTDVHSFGIL